MLNLNVRREKAEETRKKIVAENEDLRKTKESEEAKLVTLRNKVAREEAEGEETKKQLEATIKSLKTQANELTDERNAKQIEVDTAKEELEKTNKDTKDAIRKADDFVKQARAEADQIIADAKDEQLRIVADTESTLTQIKAEHEAKTVAFNELCSNFEQKQAEFAELEQKCQATVNAMKTARQNAVNELVTAIREQGLEKDQSVVERVLKELKV